MKRSPDMTDEQWDQAMDDRKAVAEQRMNAADSFVGPKQIRDAARKWYGIADRDTCCLAENRLHRGEHPE